MERGKSWLSECDRRDESYGRHVNKSAIIWGLLNRCQVDEHKLALLDEFPGFHSWIVCSYNVNKKPFMISCPKRKEVFLLCINYILQGQKEYNLSFINYFIGF